MFIRSLLAVYLHHGGTSCRSLAKQMGISHTALWRFSKGSSITADNYIKILKFILVKP